MHGLVWMKRRSDLDSYIEILRVLRLTKTIKQVRQLINSNSSSTLYKTIYYLQEKGLIQENGTTLIRSEKNIMQTRRARLYITSERGCRFISVFDT